MLYLPIADWQWGVLTCGLFVLGLLFLEQLDTHFNLLWLALAAVMMQLQIKFLPDLIAPLQIIIWLVLSITIIQLWKNCLKAWLIKVFDL